MSPHTRPAVSADELVEQARQLGLLAQEHRAESAHERRLAGPVEKSLVESDLLRMLVPASAGGLECSPLDVYDVVSTTSYHDGAAGWVLLATMLATATTAAYVGDAAVEELYGQGRLPVLAGQGTPVGVAEVVDGGYRLSGHWSYGSGIEHTTHVYSGAVVHQDGQPRIGKDGRPELLMTVVPRGAVELEGNWDVLGLSATGSVDYTIRDQFVPREYTHPSRIRFSERGGSLYTLGVIGFGCILHAAWAVGVGRRALDELATHLRGRPHPVGDAVQLRVARAEAAYRAAVAYLHTTWVDADATLGSGRSLDDEQQTLIRSAVNHITYTVGEVVADVYRMAGGTGLRAGVIQQAFRDVNASTQHLIVSDIILGGVGRKMIGLADGFHWVHHELVADRA